MRSPIPTRGHLVDMLLCFPPPRPPPRCCRMTPHIIPPCRRYGYLSPSSRSRSMFSSCYDMLDPFSPFLLCRALIFTFSFSLSLHCSVILDFPTMFSLSPLYLSRFIPSRIILTSFRQCFPNHIPSRVALYRYPISVAHLPSLPFSSK